MLLPRNVKRRMDVSTAVVVIIIIVVVALVGVTAYYIGANQKTSPSGGQ